jgi:hypothetical protein
VLLVGNQVSEVASLQDLPQVVEDLRHHTPGQLAELRLLLNVGLGRADTRRTGFFEIDGAANVYYVLRYPFRDKVLLVAVWDRQDNPRAEFVVCLSTGA